MGGKAVETSGLQRSNQEITFQVRKRTDLYSGE